MFRKIGVLKIWKKSLKIYVKELIFIQVEASSLQRYYRMNCFTCVFKGSASILMNLQSFSTFWKSLTMVESRSALWKQVFVSLRWIIRNSSFEKINAWKLPVKEFECRQVAGIYQFFPKTSDGSQVFLKHLFYG